MKDGIFVLFSAMAVLFTLNAKAAICDAENVAVAQARYESQQWGIPMSSVNFRAHEFARRGSSPAMVAVVYSYDQGAHDGFPATSGEMVGIYSVDYSTCKIVENGLGTGMLQSHPPR